MVRRFDAEALAAVEKDLVIGVRAGDAHRFTPVWAVVVGGRVFARSWGLAERSWFNAFRRAPDGAVEIGGREFPINAVFDHDEAMADAVDDAYREKYHTPASRKYVDDLNRPASRVTTTEFVPR